MTKQSERPIQAENGVTRREWGLLVTGALAATALDLSAQNQQPNPAIDIAEWSYFYYGAEKATLARGTVINGMQMYVEHWIPRETRHPYPVVLVHGGYGQLTDWLSTPDGRRGWISMLLEEGYKVYAVDRPGQGRNPHYPFIHGNYDRQAQTFASAAAMVRGTSGHTQWPGSSNGTIDPASTEIAQFASGLKQPMSRFGITQEIWRSRGVMLLEEIGPSIFLTHGDGCVFAWAVAQDRPELVKGIVALEQPANSLQGQTRLTKLAPVPVQIVTAEASASAQSDPQHVVALQQAGCKVEQLKLADHGVFGNGPFPMLEKNNREVLTPILEWMRHAEGAFEAKPGLDPSRNLESTGFRIADQGHFFVGVQRKKMPYGEIPLGQMAVQYIKPAEKRHPYPVVMVHGGGGQGTHMMGIGRRPGWVHFFVQNGYDVYWVDRPSFGRSPYHPDALGPGHLPMVPGMEGLINAVNVFATAQWPGPGGMDDPIIAQFMACERGNIQDEAFHSELVWPGGAELLDRIGPSILFVHAFGGFFGWGVADRRPDLVKAICCMEINGNPFAAQLRWGLTAAPMTYDPPVTDLSQFRLVDTTPPADQPRPIASPFKLQAEPAHKWKNLQGIPISWLTSEYGAGGSPAAQLAFLKQVGCKAEMLRLRDYGIYGNGNLMLMEKNNHEIFVAVRDWLDRVGVNG